MTNLNELIALGQLVTQSNQLSKDRKAAIMDILSKEVQENFSAVCSAPPTGMFKAEVQPVPTVAQIADIENSPRLFGKEYTTHHKKKQSKRIYPGHKVYAPEYWAYLQKRTKLGIPSNIKEMSTDLHVSRSAAANMMGKFNKAGFLAFDGDSHSSFRIDKHYYGEPWGAVTGNYQAAYYKRG